LEDEKSEMFSHGIRLRKKSKFTRMQKSENTISHEMEVCRCQMDALLNLPSAFSFLKI
jgi:hypothetical protein